MLSHNADIATIFEEIASLLEIQGANPIRIGAYHNAAHCTKGLSKEMSNRVVKIDKLTRLPAIVEDLDDRIKKIMANDYYSFLKRLRKKLSPIVAELLKILGLGPKPVKKLYHHLDSQAETAEQSCRAARNGCIRFLPIFGEKTEFNVSQAVEKHVNQTQCFKLIVAAQFAEAFKVFLAIIPGVTRVNITGRYQRIQETVGDLDLLDIFVAANFSSLVMQRFITYDEVNKKLAASPARASVRLACKLLVDSRVAPKESYGTTLHYITGSKIYSPHFKIRHFNPFTLEEVVVKGRYG